jgi:hypothetical protein
MLIRILGEGVYDVPEADLPAVEQLDAVLSEALETGEEADFVGALADLVGEVRHSGVLLGPDDARPSTLVVPFPGSTLADLRVLLEEEAT